MPGVSQGFEGFCLFFLLGVFNGECLLYKKLIFLRNNSKDKYVSLNKYFQLIIPVNLCKIC